MWLTYVLTLAARASLQGMGMRTNVGGEDYVLIDPGGIFQVYIEMKTEESLVSDPVVLIDPGGIFQTMTIYGIIAPCRSVAATAFFKAAVDFRIVGLRFAKPPLVG
nr:hypothetical protein [Tanacetum cinerariifolium]